MLQDTQTNLCLLNTVLYWTLCNTVAFWLSCRNNVLKYVDCSLQLNSISEYIWSTSKCHIVSYLWAFVKQTYFFLLPSFIHKVPVRASWDYVRRCLKTTCQSNQKKEVFCLSRILRVQESEVWPQGLNLCYLFELDVNQSNSHAPRRHHSHSGLSVRWPFTCVCSVYAWYHRIAATANSCVIKMLKVSGCSSTCRSTAWI